MPSSSAQNSSPVHTNKHFLIGLGRAFAGAILFSCSMIMTMEMWSLGFSLNRFRLTLFMFIAVPLLIGLSYYIGFEDTSHFLDDAIDALVAYAVGFITSALFLFLFRIIDPEMSAGEIIGKISIQAVIAAIGAMFAQSQLGNHNREAKNSERKRRYASYFGQLFLMGVGAIFLAMNLAPTEEIIVISFRMTPGFIIILIFLTLIMMHAFVYTVGFRGQQDRRGDSFWKVFLRFTVTGYALALLISLYLIWTFGHADGSSAENIARITVVMAFPASLGAAASRLIL